MKFSMNRKSVNVVSMIVYAIQIKNGIMMNVGVSIKN